MKTNFKIKLPGYRVGGLIGAALVGVVGLLLLRSDGIQSRLLKQASYDWTFQLSLHARKAVADNRVIVIYLDDKSYDDLGQPKNQPLDRSLDAKLINKLTADGANAVVMDMIFSDPGLDAEADRLLADAIRANGRVVLGVDYRRPQQDEEQEVPGGEAISHPPIDQILSFPYTPFRQAAAKLGLVVRAYDLDFTARQPLNYLEPGDLKRIRPEETNAVPPSLTWATAQLVGLDVARDPAQMRTERWINYYGPPDEALEGVSFAQAFDEPPGFFHNKIVFVGGRPKTEIWNVIRDELRSPYSSMGQKYQLMPGVEIHATEFLNLMRGDWLRRPSGFEEAGIILVCGAVLGFGLLRLRPIVATVVAILGIVVVVFVVQGIFLAGHVWFPFLIVAMVQIPGALLYAILYRSLEWFAQRRRLEEERRRAYVRIHEQAALLDKAHDAIIVHDLQWRAQYWNKSAEELYGWTFAEISELDLKSHVFKNDENKIPAALEEVLAHGEWSGELKQTTKSGAAVTVMSRWTLVRDDKGAPKSVLVINTDVTEQKKLESQLLRTQRMESIGTLAGGIAHDLNNVLTPIMMGVEMLRMKGGDEFTSKTLTTMAGSVKRGSDMVKQVLTFARGHEGERIVLQLGHLVKEMQKIVNETFPKSIKFASELGSNLWPILGDATQIHQIILNLCVNARDAMPEGGGISVAAKNVPFSEDDAKQFVGARPVRYVLLSVTDTGTGIPPAIIDKIFEPFFTTKEIGKGTGLGLSTVISIIKSHGGFLDLKTELGKGTSFNVYLPAAESAAAPAAAPVPAEALVGSGETVLVVDDEPAVLELTRAMLSQYGYKVVTALHGADALALFSLYKEKIKAVVMDMMMPVMDGPTAIRALKTEHPNLPCIAVSGLLQGEKLKEQLGEASVPFISKPFPSEKLLLALRKALNPQAGV